MTLQMKVVVAMKGSQKIGTEQAPLLSTEDKFVLDKAEESIKYNACCYAIPWKEKPTGLQNKL